MTVIHNPKVLPAALLSQMMRFGLVGATCEKPLVSGKLKGSRLAIHGDDPVLRPQRGNCRSRPGLNRRRLHQQRPRKGAPPACTKGELVAPGCELNEGSAVVIEGAEEDGVGEAPLELFWMIRPMGRAPKSCQSPGRAARRGPPRSTRCSRSFLRQLVTQLADKLVDDAVDGCGSEG